MTRASLWRIALTALAAPLALGLAACGDDGAQNGAKSEPIAKIAAPAGQAWSEVVAKTPEGGYRMGNPNAPIKVVEFGALSCSHCAEFANASAEELRRFVDSGRVSFELRLFMLNMLDLPAALLATCGAPESVIPLSEQFWAWQPQMFANLQQAGDAQVQAASTQPPQTRFAAIARLGGMDRFFATRGIAADQAASCLADTAKAGELAKQTETATTEHEVTGTPTFLVNGKKLPATGWPELKAELERLGAR